MKWPQILLIDKNKSVEDLKFLMFYIECICYETSIVYGVVNKQVFFTYGHNLSLFIQTAIICLQFVAYDEYNKRLKHAVAILMLCIYVLSLLFLPPLYLSVVETSTSVLNIFSRAPQIIYSHRNKTTQNLSMSTIVLSIVGNVVNIGGYYFINHDWSQISISLVVITADCIMVWQILQYDGERVRQYMRNHYTVNLRHFNIMSDESDATISKTFVVSSDTAEHASSIDL
jgi:mannose-P-dolichol utilization defect protein 1